VCRKWHVAIDAYLHPDKTRLIEFGRFAAENRRKRGERKPETFAFPGFTHSCGRTRQSSGFIVIGKPHATGSPRSGTAVSGSAAVETFCSDRRTLAPETQDSAPVSKQTL
jgi:hypothetical protein